MSNRFGRNKKRQLRNLEKKVESLDLEVRCARQNRMRESEKSMVNCFIAPDYAYGKSMQIVQTEIDLPRFIFRRQIDMELVKTDTAFLCGQLVAEFKEKVSKAIETEMTMRFSQMLREASV